MTSTTLTAAIDRAPVAPATEPPRQDLLQYRIGLRTVPYLADHGFQNMAVLPGALYVALALHAEKARSGRVPSVVRNVSFLNPIILSPEDSVIDVETRERGRSVEYTFYEAAGERRSAGRDARQVAARLEIERTPLIPARAEKDPFSIEAFQSRALSLLGAEPFYQKLRENGNQYGPGFQKVSSIWRTGSECLGMLTLSSEDLECGPLGMHPSVLDAVTQLLAPFLIEHGRTFVLRSIEKIEVTSLDFPRTLWGHAVPGPDATGERSVVGNVRAFDGSGKPYLELSGVTLALLDGADAAGERPAANLVIASNFTAEPVEDSLKFWADHFGVPLHIEFAPYDQVLQQLLDKGSALRANRGDGANVILLGLEQWAAGHRQGAMALDKDTADRCFGDRARCVLPNGLEIAHLNRYETDYVYKEIFEDQCYLRHGIRLPDDATVVDIGANIGLFSLFVMSRCRNPRIYCFEPAPALYDLLKVNCEAYGSGARALQLGVSDKPKTAALTFYENSSVFSSFHANESEDRAAIQAIVRNMLTSTTSVGEDAVGQYVDELTADRLRRRVHQCRLTTVSEIIREQRIDRIDLLKVDAEKSELDIIRGIEDADWPKIDQIVIEIHDRTGETVTQIQELLAGKGYRCAVEHEKLLERSGLFNVYASRLPAGDATGADTSRPDPRAANLQRHIDDFCAALASFMKDARAPLILCVCPAAPAAEADSALKSALAHGEQTLLARAGAIPKVQTIASTELMRRYPVADYYDSHGNQLGHIPYTPECYAAIGSTLFRRFSSLKRNPFKVIVLDCDNTLWKGVCGEDGPHGIEVSEPYRALQEFMVGQMKAGMLLCLCSKNNEKDVLEVFERRSDMVLKSEHVVARRINWKSKSDNIKSLAKELGLGLDSFIFVDDNPVECADVQANCPGVLALRLPPEAESFASFLDHVWAFDHRASTEEDRQRTKLYRENSERQKFQGQAISLKDFIDGLQIRVEIADATEDQLGRISQLTYRTNQFNFTTIRRSESEIREFLKRDGAACLSVRVSDRFGDYGLVGVVMYEAQADRYSIDTLLLSCRVLGRGVEHAILAWLGQRAVEANKAWVELACRPTEKNAPATAFVRGLPDGHRNVPGDAWIFFADRLARLQYDPDATAHGAEEGAEPDPETAAARPASPFSALGRPEALRRIAEDLCRIEPLAGAIEKFRLGREALPTAPEASPDGTLESSLLGIWRKVLGRPRIGLNDNFFEAGGSSLRAVQVIAMIKKQLNQHLSIVSLFECPTVRLLAARLKEAAGEPRGEAVAAADAARRGQQRRTSLARRHGT
jgi:FkbH-like protein/FkbM family methyltransferase